MTTTARRLLAALLVSTMALTACTGKKDDVKTVPHADALRLVEQYRDSLPGIVGDNTKVEQPKSEVSPCDGPGGQTDEHVYAASAHGQLFLPAEQHVPALRRLKEHFTQQGYTVRDDITYDPGKGGRLRVTNPADEVTIRIETGAPPVLFAILVSSPCYQSDESM